MFVRRRAHRALAACALVLALSPFGAADAQAQLTSSVHASGFSSPVAIVQDPTDPSVQMVVQQGGRIRVVRNGIVLTTDFLDLRTVVSTGGERGLLGLAFPQNYAASGRFYVNFTNTAGHTVVARFRRSADPLVADPGSRFDLRWGGSGGAAYIEQPYSNHNGGHLAFGLDQLLYIGLGDGGSGNDPEHRAQNPNELLGKMLRIDVNVSDTDAIGYTVPANNPFLDSVPVAARAEIWSFGLRNPWRYSFDDRLRGGTGALIIADVGQGAWEEINYEPWLDGGARNYGWRNREGAVNNLTSPAPAYQPLTDPTYAYGRSDGQSVTGGYVYRGRALGTAHVGRYFFGDFVSGRLWSIPFTFGPGIGEATAGARVDHTAALGGSFGNISSFGLDADGELYVVSYAGTIRKLQAPIEAPVITVQPVSSTTTVGGSVTFTAGASGAPVPGYRWQVSSDGTSWANLTDGALFSGAVTTTLSISSAPASFNGNQFRLAASNTGGTVSSVGAILTVNQPPVVASPTQLHFGATTAGVMTVTPAQTVTVTFNGAPLAWTASSNQPWLQITGGSGSGAGSFAAQVVAVPPGSASAAITISAAGAAAVSIQASVNVMTFGAAPYGVFDTPVSGAAVAGSIAVTGWALDDVAVDRVEIWRDRVAGETTAVYPGPGPGTGKVFIANAFFVTGARPDIAAQYRLRPQPDRAGWGYLLLTQGLWNQGNGPFTLYAFAYDLSGTSTTLGSKAITVSNATAATPFGAIDTPGYGATVSGSVWNYGWALTPNATPACTVPANGVQVAIDSGPLLPVNYGDQRPDIAAAFPGLTNSTGAGGAYYFDTTTLTNGTHQVGWFVTDSCGRAEGIGSRFFNVLNGAADSTAARTTAADSAATRTTAADSAAARTTAADSAAARTTAADSAATRTAAADSAATRTTAADSAAADSAAADFAVSDVVSGFSRTLGAPIEARRGLASTLVSPSASGTRIVAIGQSERVEVHLPAIDGATYAGYQVVNGERRALPLGSSLDAAAGIFYWQPAAGFLGAHDLEFVSSSAVVRVRAVVGTSVQAVIDTPQSGVVSSPFTVAGWAIDEAAASGTGIDTVHVWAYPATGASPIFLGVAAYGDARPDIGALFGDQFTGASYSLTVSHLPPGAYDLVVYPHSAVTGDFHGAQVVRVRVAR